VTLSLLSIRLRDRFILSNPMIREYRIFGLETLYLS
jgi:hypothetical protein